MPELNLDKLENELVNEIDALADFDLLTVDYSEHDSI